MGIIASGSCVVDSKNTSGFGKEGKVPLIAIFTHIGMSSKKDWIDKSQVQSLAFSLDEGKTWTKYKNNPVIKNPNLTDFRDPKVRWFEPTKRWIMTVASYDHVVYYSSPDLKDWQKESEFGKGVGGHDGVWECPDLISFDVAGKTIWVQISSINPGGINGGSATQYFVGDFDGHAFKPYTTATKWLDYGTDNYAGVTWSNTGNRNLFLGWMSNWQYANVVPTEVWRTSMTVPRELKLKKIGTDYLLSSEPVKELNGLKKPTLSLKNLVVKKQYSLSKHIKKIGTQYELNLTTKQVKDFSVILSNNLGEEVIVGYNKAENSYYIDRRKSGNVTFEKGFAKKFFGPRLSKSAGLKFKIIVDVASVELFADEGLTVMTGIFFPTETFTCLIIKSPGSFLIDELRYAEMKSIWRN